ncbi:MAG: acetolactate synthase small subunit [bacterium]|nr:acetolactate synthase small subunit [bacterium]
MANKKNNKINSAATNGSKYDAVIDTNERAVAIHEHLVTCLVENHPGVLARISGMFSSRGYNIESLAVGTTHDPSISRITIACRGDDRIIEQILKQLSKLIDVIRVVDVSQSSHVERELMLVKVAATGAARSEIMQICDIFRARIVDVHHDCLVIEVSGTTSKNEALMELFERFGILEMTRTGRIALNRGPEILSVAEE